MVVGRLVSSYEHRNTILSFPPENPLLPSSLCSIPNGLGGRERERGWRELSADDGNVEGWLGSGDEIYFLIEEAVGDEQGSG